MAWRRPRPLPPRIEYPEWVRNFHPEDWDEPDGREQAMINGNPGHPWPAELHEIHAHRRWATARYEYFRDNPAAGEQELRDLVGGERAARQRERDY